MPQLPIPLLADLKQDLRKIQTEFSDLKRILVERRRDAAYRQLKYDFAALRFETAFLRHARVCEKAGFRRDQPRWPRGTEEGGRWSGGAGNETPNTTPSATPRSRGHHFVPGELYRNEELKPETRKVFETAVTGPLRGQEHGNSGEHRKYTDGVRDAFDQFKSRNGIARSEDMTPDQAKKFVDEIRNSRDPRIRTFNMKIYMREFQFYLRRIPRRIE